MDFILDEFIVIMFLTFIIILLSSSLIAVNFYKFTLFETKNFTKKSGVSANNRQHVFNYGIKSKNQDILKIKTTYFKDE